MTYKLSRADKGYLKLCAEIDDLEEQVEYWKDLYEETNKKYQDLLTGSINHSQLLQGRIVQALLSVSEDKFEETLEGMKE